MYRSDRSRRFAFAVFAAIAALLLAATTSLAKEGGIARLAAPLPRDAEPGSTITVYWSLESFVNDKGDMGPFSAEGAYIKLVGLDVSEATGRETSPGNYVAEVIVPKGGIQTAEFGVAGISVVNGVTSRSNMVFPFQGILLQGAIPAVEPNGPAGQPGSDGSTTPQPATATMNPLLVLGALALGLGAVGTILTLRRRTALA